MFTLLNSADGHSIYVKNLPLDATHALLEEEFKRFGPIKTGGIQVKGNKVVFGYSMTYCFLRIPIILCFSSSNNKHFKLKLQSTCFGFVEFKLAGAVRCAIEVSFIYSYQHNFFYIASLICFWWHLSIHSSCCWCYIFISDSSECCSNFHLL